MPLPLLEMDFAVSLSSSAYGFDTYGLDFEAPLLCAANTARQWCATCGTFGCLCRIQRRFTHAGTGLVWHVVNRLDTVLQGRLQISKFSYGWLGHAYLDKHFTGVWSPELECGALSVN